MILSYKNKIALTWVRARWRKAHMFAGVGIHTVSVYVCVCVTANQWRQGHFF